MDEIMVETVEMIEQFRENYQSMWDEKSSVRKEMEELETFFKYSISSIVEQRKKTTT